MSDQAEEVRVVIVEDDDHSREALMALLEMDGYQVRGVGDGRQVLAAVSEFQPAVVLVDLGLPGLDGTEVTRLLRQAVGTELVIIAVTGSVLDREWQQMEEAGADFVLAKPLASDNLRRFLPPLVGPKADGS